MLEKKVYTKEELLIACSKLPENQLEAIWKQFDFDTLLRLMNAEEENRTSWKNQMSELLHRELEKYNAIIKLFDMLPAHNITLHGGEIENVSSESACDNQTDVVE